MKHKKVAARFFSIVFICIANSVFCQTPFIKLTQPFKTSNPVSSSRQFIIGSTCKACLIAINGNTVKVYPTGAFALEANLLPGDTTFTIKAAAGDKIITKKVDYTYTLPKPAEPVKTLDIENIQVWPEGNLVLMPGDRVKFKVKALTGCVVKALDKISLYELPVTESNKMPGIYQGEYVVQPSDSFASKKLMFQ